MTIRNDQTMRKNPCISQEILDRVHLGDTIEKMKELPDASFDVAIADPPYNLSKGGHWNWDSAAKIPGFGGDWQKVMETWDTMPFRDYFLFTLQWLAEVKRLVKPTGSLWVHGTYHNIGVVNVALQILGIEIINEVVWFKRNSFPNLSGRRLTASHETILWAHTGSSKKRQYQFNYEASKILECSGDQLKGIGKQMRTVWDIPNNKPREELMYGKHPTQKPVRLLMRMLAISASPGQICLVPFGGAGSECVAAERSGLHYVAFEEDLDYVAISSKRLAAEDNLFSSPRPPASSKADVETCTAPPPRTREDGKTIPPVIKWTGSKRSQAAKIYSLFPHFVRYFEPFVGGGALLFMASAHECYASDSYRPLIEFWHLVQSSPQSLIQNYKNEWEQLQSDLPGHFYAVRERFNRNHSPFDLCFLSRTCVNGIIRFNDKGEFNNSFHLSRKGMLPERFEKLVGEWNIRLKSTTFKCMDFDEALVDVKTQDFVYMDPPYVGSTNRYHANLDQDRLLRTLDSLNRRGVRWALSFDGFRGDKDLSEPLPQGLFKRHLLLKAGHSLVKKVLSGDIEEVQESLYLNY
jgi:site-specific DNA-methyltransferase (adenine-specific)